MNARRLQPIQKLAQERENERAKQLADQQKVVAEQEQRLRDLQRYAEEYARAGSGSVMNVAMLQNQRAFVEKLDGAVAQQSKQVEKARTSLEVERARLLIASREVSVLDKLAASYNAKERKEAEQRSQRELDDHATRTFARKKTE